MEFTWWLGGWARVVHSHLLLVFMDKRVAKLMAAFLSYMNASVTFLACNAPIWITLLW